MSKKKGRQRCYIPDKFNINRIVLDFFYYFTCYKIIVKSDQNMVVCNMLGAEECTSILLWKIRQNYVSDLKC